MSDKPKFDTFSGNDWELIEDITLKRRTITQEDWERHRQMIDRIAASVPARTSQHQKIKLEP